MLQYHCGADALDLHDLNPRHQRILLRGVRGGDDNDGEGEDAGDAAGITSAPEGGEPAAGTGPAPAAGAAAPKHAGYGKEPTPYERQLRDEAAATRRELERNTGAFEGLEPEVQEGVLELAGLLRENPAAARAYLIEAFGLNADAEPEGEYEPQVMTIEDFQAWQTHQAEQAAIGQTLHELRAGAAKHGIQPDTPAYDMLMVKLDRNPKQSIDDAVAEMLSEVEEARKQFIQEYLGTKNGGPSPVRGTGEGPSGEDEIETFADARRAADAFIASGGQ